MSSKFLAIAALLLSISASISSLSTKQPQIKSPQPPTVGQVAPPLALKKLLQAPEGATATWEALRGNVVVLEFWATWCAPCLAAAPHINELADQFKEDKVRFIAVTNEDEATVQPCLKKHPMHVWIGLDTDNGLSKALDIKFIPQTVVVGADGVIASITSPRALTAELLRGYVAGRRDEPDSSPSSAQPVPALPAEAKPSAGEAPNPRFQIVLGDSNRGGSWGRTDSSLDARGISIAEAMSLLFNKPSGAWVIGQPDLLAKNITIKARSPEERAGALWPMLRDAIAVTYGFEAREDEREIDVLVLAAPKGFGPDLRRSTAKTDYGHSSSAEGVIAGSNSNPLGLFNELEGLLKMPLVNETGLTGKFDWDLGFTPNDRDSLMKAIQEQFGLEVTRARRKLKVVVLELVRTAPK